MEILITEEHSKQGFFKDIVDGMRAISRDKRYHIKARLAFSGKETEFSCTRLY